MKFVARIADRFAPIIQRAAVAAFAALLATTIPARATVVTDRTAYYLCFAYTPDGMLFAGGDYDLQRAKKLLAGNCGMPKSTTVVLLKTLMKRAHGRTLMYASS